MAAKKMDEATDSATDAQTEQALLNQMKKCIQLITTYSWLIDAFLAEFFVESHWSGFPQSWQKCLQELTMNEFSDLISPGSSRKAFRNVLPLSLQAFITTCHGLSLPRKQKVEQCNDMVFSNSEQLPHSFRKHVKLKKQHEIIHLSQVVKKVTESVNCQQIVDVGGGLGHLSRYLALVHNLAVTTIEAEGHHKIIAEKFDREALQDLRKQNRKSQNTTLVNSGSIPPIHLTKMIPLEICPQEFVKVLLAAKGMQSAAGDSKMNSKAQLRIKPEEKTIVEADSFVIIGLHTCGDLASTLIRTFVNCPEVRGIVIVGCCYMKLTHTQCCDDLRGEKSTSNAKVIGMEKERKYHKEEKTCTSVFSNRGNTGIRIFEQEERATSQGRNCSEYSSEELSTTCELKETTSSHHVDEIKRFVNFSREETRCIELDARPVSCSVDNKVFSTNANQRKNRCFDLDAEAVSYNVGGKVCPANADQERTKICDAVSENLAANEATQKLAGGQFWLRQNITETKAVARTSLVNETSSRGVLKDKLFDNEATFASCCLEDVASFQGTLNSEELDATSHEGVLLLEKLQANLKGANLTVTSGKDSSLSKKPYSDITTQSDVMTKNAFCRTETNCDVSRCSNDDVRKGLAEDCQSVRYFSSERESILKNVSTESISNRNSAKSLCSEKMQIPEKDFKVQNDIPSVLEACSSIGDFNDCTHFSRPSLEDNIAQNHSDATSHTVVSESKHSGLSSCNQEVDDFLTRQALHGNNSCQDSIPLNGYPMSIYLQNQPCQPLGWDAFELACHNLDNYCQRLKDDKDKLKLQCYRAVLEVVIRKVRPDMKNPQIRCQRIKGAHKMSFKEYADVALSRINIRKQSEETLHDLNTDDLLGRWKDVIMFYCLRLLLGPVIETLLLLDRLLYLRERGFQPELIPVFDAKISPRNFVLVAKKQEAQLSSNSYL